MSARTLLAATAVLTATGLLATAAPATASPVLVIGVPVESYEASLRLDAPARLASPLPSPAFPVRPARARAKLRAVTAYGGVEWRGWTRAEGLAPGFYVYRVVVMTKDGTTTTVPVCGFEARTDGSGSCAGFLPVPSGVVRRAATLTARHNTRPVPDSVARPDMSGALLPAYRAGLFQGRVARGSATLVGRATRTWAGSGRVHGQKPGTPMTYSVRLRWQDGSTSTLPICAMKIRADGTGHCYGSVAAPRIGAVPEVASVRGPGSGATSVGVGYFSPA